MKKSQVLAEKLKNQIEHNIWLSGEKLPSIRNACKRYKLSIETVLQAYQQLEAAGYIYAKPKSGYFVLPRRNALTGSESNSKAITPYSVRISDLLYDVLQKAKDPKVLSHSVLLSQIRLCFLTKPCREASLVPVVKCRTIAC